VRVLDRGRGQRLATEALAQLRIVGALPGDHLQRHGALQLQVARR
jgi:hypothetical protein